MGRRAAVLGEESGSFEAWVWPVKLVRDLRLAFRTANGAEVDGATLVRQVTARAEAATLVYSHAGFTVREHILVPLSEAGALVLLEVQTLEPLELVVRTNIDFNLAWPGRLTGSNASWDAVERRVVLADNAPGRFFGLIGSPDAQSGSVANGAAQMVIKVDPRGSATTYVSIVFAGGAAVDSVAATYERLADGAQRHWREKVEHYRRVRDDAVSMESPDTRLDEALAWSKANLEQSIVCNAVFGCGAVAGYARSGASNYRPGRAWYFGSDGALSASALAASGQFETARTALLFLAHHQRSDGKIPGEISHAAATLPWFTHYPFAWSDAKATPLFIIAAVAHWQASNDSDLLRELWPSVLKAFRWSAATDTDGDGLMETPRAGAAALNFGALALDAWSDIYLAGTWVSALEATTALANALQDEETARAAEALRARAARTLESAFWRNGAGYHGYALLGAATEPAAGRRVSEALTAWPGVALAYGLLEQAQADNTLREIASSALTSDWGVQPLSRYNSMYAPLAGGNGAVSAQLTGVLAAADYRYHRGWSGYDRLRDIARLTFDFGRGRTPDLLSGSFYSLLDGSAAQSSAASAALITAVVRGLFGLEADAANRAVAIEPHLPADWNSATVSNFRVGTDRVSVTIEREPQRFTVNLRRTGLGPPLFVRLAPALPPGAVVTSVRIDDRDALPQTEDTPHDVHPVVEVELASAATVEIEYTGGVEVITPVDRLEAGDRSEALKVLDFRRNDRNYALQIEGVPGVAYTLLLRSNVRVRTVTGAELVEQAGDRLQLRVRMPPGNTPFVRREIIVRT